MQNTMANSWQTAKSTYTPQRSVQSIVRKHCPMMALLIMDTNTVIPCPRQRVSRGWISEEMTHPADYSSVSCLCLECRGSGAYW